MTLQTLHLSLHDLEAIRTHAAASYPEECCGFLLGAWQGGEARVARVRAADNERREGRHHRFVITPENYRAVEREAGAAGIAVLGTYHSHPDHPAEPSAYDLEHAWPGWSYLIVSVLSGRPDAVRCFHLRDDRSGFDEEALDAYAP